MESISKPVTNFQLFYHNIYDIYISEMSDNDKWENIAMIINNNNEKFVEIFKIIKNKEILQEINIDYTNETKFDFNSMNDKISKESDDIVRVSLILSGLHALIYDLISKPGNYSFTFDGKQEMDILERDMMYYICISSKKEQNIFFHAYILLYALESLFNKRFYVGIDFEFTDNKIQMCQLNFEHSVSLKSIIMIVSPNDLEQVMMDNFINLIMCNTRIKKILHGSDAKDIPYVYTHMLDNDTDKIIKFTRNMIDTRFLCEYYKLNRKTSTDNRCSIYDEDPNRSAIYYFGVINTDQQNNLTQLLESMPSPHDIIWNIHKLPISQQRYAALDVLYLKVFYYKIINTATQDEDTDLGKKNIINIYKNLVNETTRFVYLDQYEIILLVTKCKEDVDVVNNYFIRNSTGIVKLIDIYNRVIIDLETISPRVNMDTFARINHFKRRIYTIIKRIVYGYISYRCKVYKDRSTVWVDKLDNDFIYDFLDKMKFHHLSKMFRDLSGTLETRIIEICSAK
ncbi:hypothetical protein QLL95_gp0791 [Cotonvirus japonicus]|uniref:3'-5' exonuclease n=1 Tax=Cotonvirus japonicus TaxID=2811091 RepID=A0ABM7NT41_9VIRU|nr:hypothetical protein QLL95_gp0791 [Cotonvirus japonicus]BCS83332.1 hypothetical protein [Cotonvirus japonicus]